MIIITSSKKYKETKETTRQQKITHIILTSVFWICVVNVSLFYYFVDINTFFESNNNSIIHIFIMLLLLISYFAIIICGIGCYVTSLFLILSANRYLEKTYIRLLTFFIPLPFIIILIYISLKMEIDFLLKISVFLFLTYPILIGTGYCVFLLFKPILIELSQIDNPYIKIMQGWYKKNDRRKSD
jgi:hypothetical protein